VAGESDPSNESTWPVTSIGPTTRLEAEELGEVRRD
jgi:hypothetical protein